MHLLLERGRWLSASQWGLGSRWEFGVRLAVHPRPILPLP